MKLQTASLLLFFISLCLSIDVINFFFKIDQKISADDLDEDRLSVLIKKSDLDLDLDFFFKSIEKIRLKILGILVALFFFG